MSDGEVAVPAKKKARREPRNAVDEPHGGAEWEMVCGERLDSLLALIAQTLHAVPPTDAARRATVVLGANALARSVERPERAAALRCAVVCGNTAPRVLAEHLVVSCAAARVPVCVVATGSAEMGRIFGVPSVLAFALRKPASPPSAGSSSAAAAAATATATAAVTAASPQQQTLDRLAEAIIANASRVSAPWLEHAHKLLPTRLVKCLPNPARPPKPPKTRPTKKPKLTGKS